MTEVAVALSTDFFALRSVITLSWILPAHRDVSVGAR